jgi:hypothetical protein
LIHEKEMRDSMRGSFLAILVGVGLLLVSGCNKEESTPKPATAVGASAAPAPTNIKDALNNPNVPDSVKDQMRGMQGAGGKR